MKYISEIKTFFVKYSTERKEKVEKIKIVQTTQNNAVPYVWQNVRGLL